MTDSDKKLSDETPEKKPLNISDLAMNPMRVGMDRWADDKKRRGLTDDAKPKKRHWWSRKQPKE